MMLDRSQIDSLYLTTVKNSLVLKIQYNYTTTIKKYRDKRASFTNAVPYSSPLRVIV